MKNARVNLNRVIADISARKDKRVRPSKRVGNATLKRRQYRNPNVTLAEIIAGRKNQNAAPQTP
ncbi:MAG: hypothetical protein LBJ84_01410 [Oscillospiraceae bacterium]|nr:hypothetical protein [Oscillospiraceae bacterium]